LIKFIGLNRNNYAGGFEEDFVFIMYILMLLVPIVLIIIETIIARIFKFDAKQIRSITLINILKHIILTVIFVIGLPFIFMAIYTAPFFSKLNQIPYWLPMVFIELAVYISEFALIKGLKIEPNTSRALSYTIISNAVSLALGYLLMYVFS
jgi:hypothetical protein